MHVYSCSSSLSLFPAPQQIEMRRKVCGRLMMQHLRSLLVCFFFSPFGLYSLFVVRVLLFRGVGPALLHDK